MARGRKKDSEKAAGAVEKPVDKHQLIALVKESYTTKEQTAAIAGKFGERVKNAVENGRLNKKAFAFVCALHRMEELKRQAVIRDAQLYIDMIEESGLWGHQHVGNMVDEMEREEGDESSEGEDDIAAENARALRGLAQLSDEEHADNLARSGASEPAEDDDGELTGAGAVDDQPKAAPIDLSIPATLDRRKGKAKLSVVEGEPVH